MTNLTKHTGTSSGLALPRMSSNLAAWLDSQPSYADADGVGLRLAHHGNRPSADTIREAQHVLAQIDDAPADPEQIQEWLAPIAFSSRNPPDSDTLPILARAMALACQTLPAAAFNPQSQVRALQVFQFWPSPADVFKLVSEEAKPILDAIAALRRVAAMRIYDTPPASAPVSQPPAERRKDVAAYMRAQIATLEAEAAARNASPARPKPTARTLDRDTLNAIYRKEGLAGPGMGDE